MVVVRRFQVSSRQCREWCQALLTDPATPLLDPTQRVGGDVVIWTGYTRSDERYTVKASDLLKSTGELNPRYRYRDHRVDIEQLGPMAVWLCQQVRAFRYARLDPVLLSTGEVVQWPELRQTPEEYLNRLVVRLLSDQTTSLTSHGQVYEVGKDDLIYYGASVRSYRELKERRDQRQTREAALLAARRADTTLVEEYDLARELGTPLVKLHTFRRENRIQAYAKGPAHYVWYNRDKVHRIKALLEGTAVS